MFDEDYKNVMKDAFDASRDIIKSEYADYMKYEFVWWLVKFIIVTATIGAIILFSITGCSGNKRAETTLENNGTVVEEIQFSNDNDKLIEAAYEQNLYIHGYAYDDRGEERELWGSPEFWDEYQFNGGRIVLIELCDNMAIPGVTPGY